MKNSLQLRYGIVRYCGTQRYHSSEELVFQSDDAFEAMQELERLANLNTAAHSYKLTFNTGRGCTVSSD